MLKPSTALVVICADAPCLDEALTAAVEHARADAALIVCVDASPTLGPAVRDLLAARCAAPVHWITDTTALAAGAVHVIVRNGRLDVEGRLQVIQGERPFCDLLESARARPGAQTMIFSREQTAAGALLADMPVMFAELDADLRFVQLGGGNISEESQILVGQHVLDVSPHYNDLIPVYRRVLAGESVDVQGLVIGERRLDMHYRPVRRAGCSPGVGIFGYDVTAWEGTRRRLQLAADILEALPVGVVTVRQVGPGVEGFLIEHFFSSARAHLPGRVLELAGQPAHLIFPLLSQTRLPEACDRVLRTKKRDRVQVRFGAGADARDLRIHLNALSDDLLVATVEDISELVRARRRKSQSERLEAVGQLAGQVAHTLNGLLATILMHAELAQECAAPAEEMPAIIQATARAADLVAQLLAFARRRPISPQVMTVHGVVQRDDGMFRALLGPDVILRVELPETPWQVELDPAALQQALVCLLHNARDAQPAGGWVTIRVTNRAGEADRVGIEVIDGGHGMDGETRARCFEPYFTRHQGAEADRIGMGLPTVAGLVAQAKGDVLLDTTPGEGTAVTILLPRVTPEPPAARSVETTLVGPRVLVVDDEDLLRHVLVRQLKRLGYVVGAAASGAEALALVDEGFDYDLVLSDIVMPGMNGLTLIKQLRARRPDRPVILMSGYADHASLQANPWVAEVPLLYKPFEFGALRDTIESALRARAD